MILKKKTDIDIISRIVELSEKDLYRNEIAEKFSVSKSTVYKYQKLFNLV